jgi:hypothetical protein
MFGCENGWRTKRWLALFILLISHLAAAEVQIQPAPAASEETASLVAQIKRAIAEAPAQVTSTNVRVTVGPRAFEDAVAADDPRPIVAAYLTSGEFEAALRGRENRDITAVFSNPDPRDQVALAHALLGRSALAVFDSPPAHRLVQLLGESVHPLPSSREQSIDSLLRAADPFDAIIVLPDPTTLNRANINHVVRTLYERRKVLIGYSVTLARVGALASVYVTPEAIPRSVVDILNEYAASGTLPAPVFVSDIDVAVNDRLARSLNITVPEHAQLLNAVRSRRSEGAP